MEDEIKDNPQSFLEQVRQEREALEKANSEMNLNTYLRSPCEGAAVVFLRIGQDFLHTYD